MRKAAALTILIMASLFVSSCVRSPKVSANLEPLPTAIVEARPTHRAEPTATPTPPALHTPSPTPTPTKRPTPAPTVVPPTPAPTARLWKFPFVFQTRNNCGPASLAMILEFFGKDVSQKQVAEALRPNPEDKSVRPDEIVQYARQAGFSAKYLVDGDIGTVTELVSAGIPVMVRQWLEDGSDVAHFRIVVGYRNGGKILICDDTYRGQWISCSGREFEKLWHPFLDEYLVIYPKSEEAVVAAIVGSHWDEGKMEEAALKHAIASVRSHPRDAYAWHNLGRAYFLLGNIPKAAQAFEKAIRIGLPPRFFWYQYEALWAFNRTGRYREVLEISSRVLERAPSIAEVHLARGDALLGLGRKEEAIEEYRLALKYQPTLNQAKIRLFSLGACNRQHNNW